MTNQSIQVATIGPRVSQKAMILFIIAALTIAYLVPGQSRPRKPDIPLPICEAGRECKVYKIGS